MGPGEIPKVTLPVDPKTLGDDLRRLRAHADHLDRELKTTKRMIRALEGECDHVGSRYWNTGDGDGSQGFECPKCGTTGTR